MTPREQGELEWIAIPNGRGQSIATDILPILRDHQTGIRHHREAGSSIISWTMTGSIDGTFAYATIIAGAERFEDVCEEVRDRRARRMILAALRCMASGPYGDRLPRTSALGGDAELLSILRAREAVAAKGEEREARISAATPLRSGGLTIGATTVVHGTLEPGCIDFGPSEDGIEPDGTKRLGITIMANAKIIPVPHLDPVSRMRLERRVDGLDGDPA